MRVTKLMLSILAGGLVLGTPMAQTAKPVMKPGQEADWRRRLQPQYSSVSERFVDAGPQDLAPPAGLPSPYVTNYRVDYGPAWDDEIRVGSPQNRFARVTTAYR